jgi:PAS domain S-box-containing protein
MTNKPETIAHTNAVFLAILSTPLPLVVALIGITGGWSPSRFWLLSSFLLLSLILPLFLYRELKYNKKIKKYKEAERFFVKTEERYSLMTDGSGDGLWDIDTTDDTIWYSPAYRNLLGYEGEHDYPSTLQTWRDGIHPDDRTATLEAYHSLIENGTPYNPEYRIRNKQGEWRWLKTRSKSQLDEQGKIYRVAGAVTDITDQKLQQEQLKHSNLLLNIAQELSHSGAWYTDNDHNLDQFVFSPNCAELLGHPSTEGSNHLPSKDWENNLTSTNRTLGKQAVALYNKALIDPSVTYDATWQYTREFDGKVIWVRSRAEIIRNESGQFIEVYGVCQDITEQKNSEFELAQKHEDVSQFRTALDSLSDSLYLIDLEKMKFIDSNRTGWECLGYERDELLNMGPHDLKLEYNRETLKKKMVGLLEETDPKKSELNTEHQRKDGTCFPVGIRLKTFESKSSKIVISVVHDKTEHNRTEGELLQAKESAENANRSKSEFLANMSHEIRTPMNAIIGLSDLALQTGLNDTQWDYIEKVRRSAKSLLGIINDILDFSKIEAGQLDMESTDFRLEDVLDNLKNVLSLKTDETGVALTFDVPSDLPLALIGDPLRLGQVLINIGGNAAKFTKAGKIEVSVKKVSQGDDQINLQFSIKDTGIGMSPEQQAQLFKAFNQADSSTTRKYGGTGLGMTISQHLVEMMGGKIWVESAEGIGSTVYFTVNMGVQQNILSSKQHKRQKANNVSQTIGQLRGARILLVEDNEFNQVLALHVLSSNGLIPTLAKDGQQALDILASQDFDGVLMDCQMPVMDGYVATQEIRKQAKYRDLPILAMTANAMAGDREKVLAAGMNAHIAKPFTQNELFSTMVQWIGRDK